jgi:hypothetical protein
MTPRQRVVDRAEFPGDRDYACNHIPSLGTFLVRLDHVDLDVYRTGIYQEPSIYVDFCSLIVKSEFKEKADEMSHWWC